MEYSDLKFKNDDKLGRKDFVRNLMQIVDEWQSDKHEGNSLVMSIDAPWGSGKSYLLNMWKNWLGPSENKDKNYCTTYYNAWENDDCENAFIPLVYKLRDIEVYGKDDKFINDTKTKAKAFLKSCGIALVKDGIKKIIGEETANLFDKTVSGEIVNVVDKAVDQAAKAYNPESFFKKYEIYNQEKKKFRKALKDLVPDDGKLIVFVDELDRCRPTFAVETLEIVKHYFNIPNVVFIFGIDLEQLAHSIETLYGVGMDSAGYLRRFFDVNIKIPNCNIKKYVDDKLSTGIIYEMLKGDNKSIYEDLINKVTNVYVKLNLSLRDINKITDNFLIFFMYYKGKIHDSINNEIADKLEMYLYFIVLKYKYPEIYSMLINDKFIAYNDAPKDGYVVLKSKYYISDNINKLLALMQCGGILKKENTLIQKYGFTDINCGRISFAEHIERTIEMFT